MRFLLANVGWDHGDMFVSKEGGLRDQKLAEAINKSASPRANQIAADKIIR